MGTVYLEQLKIRSKGEEGGGKRKSLIKEEELDDEGHLVLNGKGNETLLFELDMDST